mmetsp:Transcript_797/g.1258  ORF Transcript_797/g.1258 Transcript_797/m.1258 type:complete len:729 (+) Transcript_797:137-2323(+)|eukprot:CAMPEP_0195305840 /NCGR_PEP_ID=MMETSP0707-20130614/36895_1 /TAXON_ID=33640 /ORGANISM="Asterionellopsis glacialis, Strain CCMP134" /LENGTH=728 /DNA_ID=CAMNT_0040370043 /DNA_START=72 /DNA_END=2258 /DNA_ORIENTATION=-
MRLALAVQVAISIGVLSCTSSAFVPQSIPRTFGSNTRIQVGSWENDDFLEALSGGSNAQDKANDDYQAQSKFKPGEEPPSASDTSDESSQGGTRLQQLMAQAKNAESQPQGPRPQPMTYKPPVYNPPNAAQEPPAAAPTQPGMPSLDNLSVEEQAELFRRFMAGGQQLPQPVEAPAPSSAPVMRGGVDRQGRKIGRNKDSDTIANSSDLYFAQLKADSTIRTIARYSGDDNTAANVMGHEAIQEIADTMKVNPYLEAQKEEERKLLETSEDELLSLIQITERPQHEPSYTGISFRDKLRQAKEKKAGAAAAASSPTAQSTPAAAEPKVESPPVIPPPPVAAVVPPPAPVIPPPVAAVAPPPAPVVPPPPVAAVVPPPAPVIPPPVAAVAPPPAPAVVAPPPPAPVVAAPEPASTTSLVDADAETKRRSIRTLMGLMLKHRGGPGFGAGRLKEPEAQKLESLLGDVIGMLRAESGTEAPPAATTVDVSATASAQATAPAAASYDFDRLTGTIACIDGAVEMYKKSAAEEKSENLLALRAALMAAVNSCNTVIAEGELAAASTSAAPPATAPAAPTGMGFPDTFAVTKPEAPAASTGMGFPDSYAVTKPDAPAIGPDANTAVLEEIYEKLKDASGDGKLGLKSDLTSAEADVLVDELVSMRDVLMEELDSGIPSASQAPAQPQQAAPADPAPPAEVDSSADTGVDPFLANSKSKYAQMLAKAQANKKNGQ